MDHIEIYTERRLDSAGSGYVPLSVSCEHYNALSALREICGISWPTVSNGFWTSILLHGASYCSVFGSQILELSNIN